MAMKSAKSDYKLGQADCGNVVKNALDATICADGDEVWSTDVKIPNSKFNDIKLWNPNDAVDYKSGILADDKALQKGEEGKTNENGTIVKGK